MDANLKLEGKGASWSVSMVVRGIHMSKVAGKAPEEADSYPVLPMQPERYRETRQVALRVIHWDWMFSHGLPSVPLGRK